MGDVIDCEALFENKQLAAFQRKLQREAVEIMNVALLSEPLLYESSLGFVDTAPSEYSPESA